MGVFLGGGVPPIVQEIFAASIFSDVRSGQDNDCSRTAPGHCYSSTQQLQQRQVSKRLYGLLPVTMSESESTYSLRCIEC